jgi:hypothetical protein
MRTKSLKTNVYEYEKDKLPNGCHISFRKTPLIVRHLVDVNIAVYVVSVCNRYNLDKTGKISKLTTCIISEILKSR